MGSNTSFFFHVNVSSAIKVGFSSEGGGGVVVYSAFKCITL
jgi:hypothetical protein